MAETTATIIVNPRARRLRHFDGEQMLRRLEERGLQAQIEKPDSPAGTTEAAARAAERGDSLVLVLGGDGTVRLTAGALAGSESALAVLPGGTANVWAAEAGIPSNLLKALDEHLDGQQVAMDLGWAGDEPFILMAGIGWDAQIAAQTTPRLKERLGVFSYVLQSLPTLPQLRTTELTWSDGEQTVTEQVGLIVVSNTRLYGGILTFSPEASARDGLLDTCIFSPQNTSEALLQAGKVVMRRHHNDRHIHELRTEEFVVETPGLPIQIDGDVVGETPVTLRCDHEALLMSVPAGPLTQVLQAPGGEHSRSGGLLDRRATHPQSE